MLTKYEDDNVLELFAFSKRNIFIDMYNLFLEFQNKNPKQFYQYLQNLYEEYFAYFSSMSSVQSIPENINLIPYKTLGYKEVMSSYASTIKKQDEKLQQLYKKIDDVDDEVFLYTAFLQIFLKNVLNGSEHIFWFDTIMPLFKYAPILSFERGRNQQGLFIYQTYLNYTAEIIDTTMLTRQSIWPNVVIVIENKEKFLEELDFIGINEKFIYGDYDNIAKYIKRSFNKI
ncbi:hypothetical protein IK9_05981 [Bacillus cereus VD166]|nr:hypothetical protein IK9_05981 [Bacillus cereus VD166]